MSTWHGTYNAVVVDTNDPLGLSRVRLYVPQIHGEAVTGWAAPVSSGKATPGDRVVMSYAGGDQNYPIFWPVALGGIAAGPGLRASGAGTAASPYTLSAALSADAGNGLLLGSDQGLFARAPQTGTVSVTVASAANASTSVTFPRPYAAAPVVFTNFTSSAGATTGWSSRAINITAASFSAFILGTSSSFTVTVDWLAFPIF